MKISFISLEYPADAAYGGIGTYVYQVARMLQKRGHHVEVFSTSPYRVGCFVEDEIIVHRVQLLESESAKFSELIAPIWAKRHGEIKFDVLEGPEFGADAEQAVKLVPNIPLVVKLHTPRFMTAEGTLDGMPFFHPLRLNMLREKWQTKLKYYWQNLKQGKIVNWRYTDYLDVAKERNHTLQADVIVAPSREIGEKLLTAWQLDPGKIMYFPYPYIPSEEFLKIPIETQTNIVTFLGRIEIRKGVLDLAKAIPVIYDKFPAVKFRLIGLVEDSPDPDLDMQQYLEKQLAGYLDCVEFRQPVPLAEVPKVLANTDICVFPSIWDNFPNVCLEAMSAGRGVVGSSAGGMAEMLDANRAGRIVTPRSPEKIAEAVIELLENPSLRMELGRYARQRILDVYNLENISQLQEASYQLAMERRQKLGSRINL